jgi:putative cell wall-binding protein
MAIGGGHGYGGGAGGAGIGGGNNGTSSNISISDGTVTAIGYGYSAGIGGGSGAVGDPSTSVSIAPEAEVHAFAKETSVPAIDAYYGNADAGHYVLAYLDAVSYERTLSFYADGSQSSSGQFTLPADYASFAYTTGSTTARTDRIFASRLSPRAYLGRAERVYDSSPDIASTRDAAPTALRLNADPTLMPPDYDLKAPSLSAGSATRNSARSVTVNFTSDEAGRFYLAGVAPGAPAPTVNTSGSGTPLTVGAQSRSFSLTGFGSSAVDLYLVTKDAAGNVSAPLKISVPAYVAPVTRHEGGDRQDTAARASTKAYPDPSRVDSVILAYSYDFPDALAASYLAGVLDAPILLCDTNKIPATTAAELSRLNPSAIYIVGGTGVISSDVEGALGSLPGVTSVTRLGGAGREETAYLIASKAKELGGTPATAFVAHSGNFPDALSAGSLSAGQRVPILLTPSGALDSWAQRFLEESGVADIIIVGGTGSVSEAAADQLRALPHKPSVARWSGPGRYETAAAVLNNATAKWGIAPTVIGLASGEGFPDALVGGAAVGNRGGLLAITDPDTLSAAAAGAITTYKDTTLTSVEIFGGPGTIRVANAVQGLLA